MKQSLSIVAVALGLGFVLSACDTVGTQDGAVAPNQQSSQEPVPTPAPEPAPQTEASEAADGSVNVTFLDTSGFDSDLSQGLSGNNQEVVVDAPAKFNLNNIPERINVWFSKIQESGGKVQAQPIPQEGEMATRGLLGLLIDVVVSLVDVAYERAMYGPAEDYNVLLHYDAKTGEVERATFYRR